MKRLAVDLLGFAPLTAPLAIVAQQAGKKLPQVVIVCRAVAAGLVALAALAVPLCASAQQAGRVYRIGFIATVAPVSTMAGPQPVNPPVRALLQGLRDLGYVEGRNLVLELRSAEGRYERFADIVAELVRLKTDVIVTNHNEATRQAKAITASVPIVMAGGTYPVEAGLVQSLAKPGGNVTGLTFYAGPEIEAKRLELLKETVPRASRIAYLGIIGNWESRGGKTVRAAAQALGLTLFLAEHKMDEFADAFASITARRPDALFVSNHASSFLHRELIVDFSNQARLPSMHAFRESVEGGGLMSYGVSLTDLYRRAAGYVDRILKGANPGVMPIEQPTKFELVINLKTAKALGLTIPQSVLLRADQVIE